MFYAGHTGVQRSRGGRGRHQGNDQRIRGVISAVIGGEKEPILSRDQMRESSSRDQMREASSLSPPLSDREIHQTSPFLIVYFFLFYLVSTLTMIMFVFSLLHSLCPLWQS